MFVHQMGMKIGVMVGVMVLGFAAACASNYVTVQRMGAVYLANPPACEIRFENLNYQEATARYEQIGLVTLAGNATAAFTEEMKETVRSKACEIGGNVATLNASSDSTANYGGGATFQFLILRDRVAPSTPAAAPSGGEAAPGTSI